MNERITQLALKAYNNAGQGTPEALSSFMEVYSEKFAELIVRECLDVVALRLYLGSEEICRQECKALASEIKEYFGVEE